MPRKRRSLLNSWTVKILSLTFWRKAKEKLWLKKERQGSRTEKLFQELLSFLCVSHSICWAAICCGCMSACCCCCPFALLLRFLRTSSSSCRARWSWTSIQLFQVTEMLFQIYRIFRMDGLIFVENIIILFQNYKYLGRHNCPIIARNYCSNQCCKPSNKFITRISKIVQKVPICCAI